MKKLMTTFAAIAAVILMTLVNNTAEAANINSWLATEGSGNLQATMPDGRTVTAVNNEGNLTITVAGETIDIGKKLPCYSVMIQPDTGRLFWTTPGGRLSGVDLVTNWHNASKQCKILTFDRSKTSTEVTDRKVEYTSFGEDVYGIGTDNQLYTNCLFASQNTFWMFFDKNTKVEKELISRDLCCQYYGWDPLPWATATTVPTAEPTTAPTTAPTAEPTAVPTTAPTADPTAVATAEATTAPSVDATAVPTVEPTAVPTQAPAAAVANANANANATNGGTAIAVAIAGDVVFNNTAPVGFSTPATASAVEPTTAKAKAEATSDKSSLKATKTKKSKKLWYSTTTKNRVHLCKSTKKKPVCSIKFNAKTKKASWYSMKRTKVTFAGYTYGSHMGLLKHHGKIEIFFRGTNKSGTVWKNRVLKGWKHVEVDKATGLVLRLRTGKRTLEVSDIMPIKVKAKASAKA